VEEMTEGLTPPLTRRPLPLILIRGFGGLGVEDEKRIAYQGFNDGTVYPRKRGENYIYEGLILRLMKSGWSYEDATNVVGYYGKPAVQPPEDIPDELRHLDLDFFSAPIGDTEEDADSKYKVVIDPAMALHLLRTARDVRKTLWVFRYYDLDDRSFASYGSALARLIDLIRSLAAKKDQPVPRVNVIAHSMGGLIVRETIQRTYPDSGRSAADYINKVVTLGTPHRGISFQLIRELWLKLRAEDEIEHFNEDFQKDSSNQASYVRFHEYFPLNRMLTVVGTNYKTYGSQPASWANRLFSVGGEYGPNYNRSDGLVKQTNAQVPGAPRTFVHKCHGGADSLVTSREAFEIATRFFFGNLRVRLRMLGAEITRGKDLFGKSEFFLGVCVKPRRVDFELFHQSAEAENCYGPFRKSDLTDNDIAFPWAGDNRLIWEGYLDTLPILEDDTAPVKDLVMRIDFYVGERDLFGLGFSDNVIFYKQYYVRALLEPKLVLFLHTDEKFARDPKAPTGTEMTRAESRWEFGVEGTGFQGRFGIEVDSVPEEGDPLPIED
jgi:pimeloyl-ACP methyl ester carboxylesterase